MGLVLAQITMDVEDTFGVELPDSAAYHLVTAGDFRRLILEQLTDSGRLIRACAGSESFQTDPSAACRWRPRQVWAALREIIHRTGGLPLQNITPDARLIEDLMLD